MLTMLDVIQRVRRGEVPPPPVAQLIGFTLREAEPGRAVIDFEADARHANPMGTVHGGILCDIADAAMGIAYAATLGEGETFTTVELKINFLKPVWTGKLVATGRVVKGGRIVGLVECDVGRRRGARRASVEHVHDLAGRAGGRPLGVAGDRRYRAPHAGGWLTATCFRPLTRSHPAITARPPRIIGTPSVNR